MKKVVKLTIRSLLLITLSFCVFNIITSYAGEPIFKLTSISVKEKSAGVTVNDVDLNNDEISNDVEFTDIGDYITYDLKIKNTGTDDYKIISITDNNSSEYLNYSYTDLSNTLVKAGNEQAFNLTITYYKQSTDPTLATGTASLIITYEKQDGEQKEEEVTPPVNPENKSETEKEKIIINPQTKDNVVIYFVLSTISIIGLIVLSKDKKKSKMLSLALIALVPLYVKANTIQFTIKFNNTIKAVAYDVEIDLDNGTTINYSTIAKGGKVTKPSNPNKRGYTFDNWYLNNNVYDFNTPVTGPITLEARYNIENYEITYDLDGGSLESGKSNPTEYNVNTPSFTLNNPVKTGHVFSGWKLNNSDEVNPSVTIFDEVGAKNFKAIYTPETYIITFNPNNGENTFTTTASYGSKISAPAAPTKTGFTFSYWSLNDQQFDFANTTIEGAITLVANYTPNGDTPYKVTHKYRHLNDSGFETFIQDNLTGTTGDEVDLAFVPREGFLNPSEVKKLVIAPDGSAEEEYIYERKPYTLEVTDRTYVDNVNSTADGTNYLYETLITLIANDRTGYDFVGWKIGSDIVSTSKTYEFNITSNVSIEPVYEVQNYTITFDPNNGENTFTDNADYGTKVTKPNDPSKTAYTFDYWTLNNEEFDFTNTNIEGPITLVAHYTPTTYHITYVLNDGEATNETEYTIEDTIHLNNPTKTGYDFVGWSKNSEVETSDDVTISNQYGDVVYTAHYNARNDIHYKIVHKYRNLPGSQEEFDIVEQDYYDGTADQYKITAAQYREGFATPLGTVLYINPDGSAVKTYIYEREEYSLYIRNRDDVDNNTSSPDGLYPYGTIVYLIAKDKPGHSFDSWRNTSDNSVYSYKSNFSFSISENIDVYPSYNTNKYTVEYDPNHDDLKSFYETRKYNETIDEFPVVTRDGYVFAGWFTEPNGGKERTAPYTVYGDETLYAHWEEEAPKLCQRAKLLHYEQCSHTTDTGCYHDGFVGSNNSLFYGSIVGQNEYKSGDAFDCDVNGNGVIDTDVNGQSIERFYYMRQVDDNHAALIYYSNVVGGENNNTTSFGYGQYNYSVPNELISQLPSSSSWNNTSLISDEVQVVNELDQDVNGTVNLPIINYSGYTSRMPVLNDIEEACGINVTATNVSYTVPVQSFTGCSYLFENTDYINPNVKSGYWVATAVSGGNAKVFRVTGHDHQLGNTNASSSTGSGIRPVIEVSLNQLEEPYDEYTKTVSFDTMGGNGIPLKEVHKGSMLGELPEDPVREGFVFMGWYTDKTWSVKVTENTVINDNYIIYARWAPVNAKVTMDEESYLTLSEAFDAVPNDGELHIITLMADLTNEYKQLGSNLNVILDLNGHSITMNDNKFILNNKTTNSNKSTLTVRNGTLTSTASTESVINNEQKNTIYLENVTINANGGRAGLYNKAYAYILDGTNIISTSDSRAAVVNTVENNVGGELYVLGGNITSTSTISDIPAIKHDGEILVIGTDDGHAQSTPVITGYNKAVISNKNFYFYDGILKGKSGITNNDSYISTDLDTYNLSSSTEDDFNVLSIVSTGCSFLYLNLDGGSYSTVPNIFKCFNQPIGELDDPTKENATFDGWYYESTFENRVKSTDMFTKKMTIYAKWIEP